MPRPWLPHPPATVNRPRPCPTRLPRYSTRWLALAALPIGAGDARLAPVACGRCGGWHQQDAGPRALNADQPDTNQENR